MINVVWQENTCILVGPYCDFEIGYVKKRKDGYYDFIVKIRFGHSAVTEFRSVTVNDVKSKVNEDLTKKDYNILNKSPMQPIV